MSYHESPLFISLCFTPATRVHVRLGRLSCSAGIDDRLSCARIQHLASDFGCSWHDGIRKYRNVLGQQNLPGKIVGVHGSQPGTGVRRQFQFVKSVLVSDRSSNERCAVDLLLPPMDGHEVDFLLKVLNFDRDICQRVSRFIL